MKRTLSRPWTARIFALLIITLSPCHLVWGQEAPQRANLRVRLPADARLIVDGKETKQTGSSRRFVSPPLMPGKSYRYTFQWTYRQNGKSVTRTRTVSVRAGENKEVDLTAEDNRADKEKETEGPEPKLDVPFEPTPQDVVDKMLELAVITDKDVVYDLGCGDGRIVVTAAKKYGCQAVGFDLDPKRVEESRENVKANEVEKLVAIEKKDLFDVDLKPANVVTLFLLPDANVKLIPQLEQLKPGARVLSHEFTIKGIEPKHTVKVASKVDGRQHTIYVWIAPLKKK